jgi:hypothetical protein
MHWWIAVGPCDHCLACSRRRLRESGSSERSSQAGRYSRQAGKQAATGKGGIVCLRGNFNAQWSRLSPTGPSLPIDGLLLTLAAAPQSSSARLACCKNRNQDRCRWPIWVTSAPDGTLSRRRQHEAPYGRPSPSNSDRMKSRSARKIEKAATNGSVPTCCSKQMP